jgi:hypothetical protein
MHTHRFVTEAPPLWGRGLCSINPIDSRFDPYAETGWNYKNKEALLRIFVGFVIFTLFILKINLFLSKDFSQNKKSSSSLHWWLANNHDHTYTHIERARDDRTLCELGWPHTRGGGRGDAE